MQPTKYIDICSYVILVSFVMILVVLNFWTMKRYLLHLKLPVLD